MNYVFGDQDREKFYRFMHRGPEGGGDEYLEAFLTGEKVKIGSVDEFRGPDTLGIDFIENPEVIDTLGKGADSKYGIDDPLEATSLHKVGLITSFDFHNKNSPRHSSALEVEKLLNIFSNSSDVCIRGSVIRKKLPNTFIFCGSNCKRSWVLDKIKADSARYAGRPYDVCIPIIDPLGFADALARGVAKREGWEKVPDTYRGDVQYENLVRELDGWGPKDPHPHIKHSAFSMQKEYRIVVNRFIAEDVKGGFVKLDLSEYKLFDEPFKI